MAEHRIRRSGRPVTRPRDDRSARRMSDDLRRRWADVPGAPGDRSRWTGRDQTRAGTLRPKRRKPDRWGGAVVLPVSLSARGWESRGTGALRERSEWGL